MAFQPVPDTAQIDILFSYQAQVMQNSLHAQYLFGAYDQTALQALANAVDSWVNTSYKPRVSNQVTYDRVEVRGLALENDLVEFDNSGTGLGTSVGAVLPLNVTKCFSLRSGLTGRSARGRFYSVGMLSSDVDPVNRTIATATYISLMISALTAYLGAIILVNWVPVITSRWHNGIKRPAGINFALATVISVNNTTDSMRGRLPD